MRDIQKPLVQPHGATLSTWISTLGPGSPCFCCGAPLRTSPLEVAAGSAPAPRLTCPSCGAEVFGETAVPAWVAVADRDSTLVAA